MGLNKVTSPAKLSAKQKIQIVSYAEKYGIRAAVENFGVRDTVIYNWKSIIKHNKYELLEPTVIRRRFDLDTKVQAVLDYQTGKYSKAEICIKYGLRGNASLDRWIKRYNNPSSFVLALKNKKLGSKMSYSLEIKRKLVDLVVNGLPIPQAAKRLEVPVSTAYDWINAYNKDEKKFFATKAVPKPSEELVPKVILEEITNLLAFSIETEEELRKFKYRYTKLMNNYPDCAHYVKSMMDIKIELCKKLEASTIEVNTLRFIDSVKKRMDSKKPQTKP